MIGLRIYFAYYSVLQNQNERQTGKLHFDAPLSLILLLAARYILEFTFLTERYFTRHPHELVILWGKKDTSCQTKVSINLAYELSKAMITRGQFEVNQSRKGPTMDPLV